MIFQFSSFEDESYIKDKLEQAISRLGGNHDESKVRVTKVSFGYDF